MTGPAPGFVPAGSLTLDEVLRQWAAHQPDAPALIYAREPSAGRTCTFAELDRLADAFASALIDAGVAPGARVAVILSDEPACLGAVYGILRAGAIVVPIDSAWGPISIASTLVHAGPVVVTAATGDALHECGLDEYAARFLPFTIEGRGSIAEDGSRGRDGITPLAVPVASRATDSDVAMLAFTSGTTSRPKGVVIRHRHFRAAYRAGAELLGLRRTRRFGCMFRLSGLGILGMNYFLAHEVGAATVVLPEFSLATVKTFWADARRHAVEYVYLVPAVVQIMNKVAEPLPHGEHAPAMLCVTAAAPISRQNHAEFQERFGVPLRNAYGLTEASFAVFFGKTNVDGTASRSIGKAIAVQARLLGDDGREIDGPGVGALELRGPMVTDGYWQDPEATEKLMHDGWLRTGDIAERDEDGNFQICGRIKDVVIRGGFNIHLTEVEEALLAHPEVAGACAVGLPDPLTGEELYAMVQLARVAPDAQADVQTIERWARARLGQTRAPRRIFVSDELPRNGAGKIVRSIVASEVQTRLRPGATARTPAS
ncbi:MAG TPA: class I adenylate-forming enzyme family protein [Kofleriaceae bacterium]|nr:class I adenylate-forming enzyme family protein [Kofleriaceae bacterium]